MFPLKTDAKIHHFFHITGFHHAAVCLVMPTKRPPARIGMPRKCCPTFSGVYGDAHGRRAGDALIFLPARRPAVPDNRFSRMRTKKSFSPTDGKYRCKTLRNRVILYSSVLLQCYLKAFKIHNNNNIQRYSRKINLSDSENVVKKGFFLPFAGRFRRFLRVDRKKIHDATRWLSARWCGGTKNN